MGDFMISAELVVRVDGSSEVLLVRVTDPRIEPMLRKAISKWKFIPAKCGDRPIEVEIVTKNRD